LSIIRIAFFTFTERILPILVSGFSIFPERIFHSYRADFSYLPSGFSISTERIFHYSERIFHFTEWIF
jgi:hypothetical protein